MEKDIIDWDARQKKLKKKVEEYEAANAQNRVEEYLHSVRCDPTVDRLEVLQAILDHQMEQRRLLVLTGANDEAFALLERQIADMQRRLAND